MQTELLSIWRKSRKTVLLITHQIDEAVFLSDRVIIFSAPRVRSQRGVDRSSATARSRSQAHGRVCRPG
jgi:ABC-type nitrate/sulfonate/bicarbonate transport system ATPase subunit